MLALAGFLMSREVEEGGTADGEQEPSRGLQSFGGVSGLSGRRRLPGRLLGLTRCIQGEGARTAREWTKSDQTDQNRSKYGEAAKPASRKPQAKSAELRNPQPTTCRMHDVGIRKVWR